MTEVTALLQPNIPPRRTCSHSNRRSYLRRPACNRHQAHADNPLVQLSHIHALIQLGDRLTRYRQIKEAAQRLPAISRMPNEEPFLGYELADVLVVCFEALTESVEVVRVAARPDVEGCADDGEVVAGEFLVEEFEEGPEAPDCQSVQVACVR